MELSDEEIKAIEKVKEVSKIDKESRIVTIYDKKPLFRDQLQIIIDLLNKLQEKIVDLETKLEIAKIENKYIQEERDEETIPRYKIREKIKELETAINQNKIMSIQVRQHGFAQKTIEQYVIRATVEILKELLKEN